MMDLKISYDNEEGKRISKDYPTIMDFTDEMESDKFDIPMLDYRNVEAELFEKSAQRKSFDTIADLYDHCKQILK